MHEEKITYCGYVEIIGRSNVGKSTLFNKLICKKLSIVSDKPQTTWYSIIGVSTSGVHQIIYKDNPGIIKFTQKRMLNKLVEINSIYDILIKKITTLIIFVVEGIKWTYDDQAVLNELHDVFCPIILLINKVDEVYNKKLLLPHIQFLNNQIDFYVTLPVCIKNDTYPMKLVNIIKSILPIAKHQFSKDYVTNCSQEFIVSEIIREKLMWFLGGELPYISKVYVDQCEKNKSYGYKIYGSIVVKREEHKKIIIGKQGDKIKKISIAARQDMENLFKMAVHLEVWVKVKSEKFIAKRFGMI
ncbi:GTPase Era [Blochmannia endosymbiont of Camponotus (Colobopsis) obliquus]|uniref:GTPase Era n=1 Tax=Blochmannia endosymbiont of Camponotus (Colobopsis) obliquus TaxID=1505597 RepID=UPI00061A5BE2|nr:GTPase Era [Blochmannia endosymbiont of Camponotus (Colobopsis) obliquus]AKC60688.1 GTPase Era [Blochmannia endosymbiont of Camponotus (Colobopsis) obliquus]